MSADISESEDMVKGAVLGAVMRVVEMVESVQLSPTQGSQVLNVIFGSFNRFILDRDLVELVSEADTAFSQMHQPRVVKIYGFESEKVQLTVEVVGLTVRLLKDGSQLSAATLDTEVELGAYVQSMSDKLKTKGFIQVCN
ncbi:hypothetical protein [Shewanella glacialipiscicola]|uniref:hypothetical protein n=1 Tax=Shewanella glacialipiscicola TaxID=614069 RepID=UPI003D793622